MQAGRHDGRAPTASSTTAHKCVIRRPSDTQTQTRPASLFGSTDWVRTTHRQ